MRIRTRVLLAAAIGLAIAAPTLACECGPRSVSAERKKAALVFVGRALEVRRPGDFRTIVSFEVLQTWDRGAAAVVTVESSGLCGYYPHPGGVYVIFAYRSHGEPGLYIHYCSNNTPLLCAEWVLRKLGRPTFRYKPLPRLDDIGSDEAPLGYWVPCVVPPRVPDHCKLGLPRGVVLRNYSATILRSGKVHDLKFDLVCDKDVADKCTPEFAASIRTTIEQCQYEPATWKGKPVAWRP